MIDIGSISTVDDAVAFARQWDRGAVVTEVDSGVEVRYPETQTEDAEFLLAACRAAGLTAYRDWHRVLIVRANKEDA